jgi:signal transduction histidine kinase
MTASSSRSRVPLAAVLAPLAAKPTYLITLDLLLDLPLGFAWFIVFAVGLAVGAGLAVTVVGMPLLIAMLALARGAAAFERRRARLLLGLAVDPPGSLALVGSWRARLGLLLRERTTWKSLAYLLLQLPFGLIGFGVAASSWGCALALTTAPIWGPFAGAQMSPSWYVATWPARAGSAAIGLLLLVVAPRVVRGFGSLDRLIGERLLSGSETSRLQARVRSLERGRERWLAAAEAERRRIERDLHDGAQQRLTALALELGRARESLAESGDPATAAQVAAAHEEAKRAIAELRTLARGVHPVVLADRGLDAALSGLAARMSIPVQVRVDLPGRLPAPLETVAYFVVAEGLTNVTRHSSARHARVTIEPTRDRLAIEVWDDGAGGADPARGTGLAGLADRLAAVDGTLEVLSPPGGPTRVRGELPCEL